MSLVIPAIEERAERDAPVAIEPGAHELDRSRCAQALLVGAHVDVLVVVNLRRNEHALQMGQWVANDRVSVGSRIHISGFDPVVATSTRIAGCPHANRNSSPRSEGGHEAEY